MRERLFILLALVVLSSALGEARSIISKPYDPKGKIKTELRISSLLDELPTSGYYSIRVYINNDAKINRTWRFNFVSTDSDPPSEGNELRSSFSVPCDAKSSTQIDLMVPLVTIYRDSYGASAILEIEVQAPAPLPNSHERIETEVEESWPSVMIGEELYTRNGNALEHAVSSSISGGSTSPPGISGRHRGGYAGAGSLEFGAAFDPKSMSNDWRAYSGYDACLLTENEWEDLPVGAKTALLKWNRMGGALFIYTRDSSTTLATLSIDKEGTEQRSADLGWGTIRLKLLLRDGLLPPDETVKMVLDSVNLTGGNRLHNLRNNFRSSWPLQTAFGSKTAHIFFFIFILIIFGILVGPVNLFVFARAGRRHKLFITTPIISLGASALLVVLILFQDGLGGRGQRIILHEVGPDNSAYLSQEQIARTGVLLNTSFTTSDHGYLSPVMISNSRWARVTLDNEGGRGRYNVALEEDGLKVTGDWFQSRSEHGHIFETIRPSRGRINLVSTGSAPVVNSTFEFPLETLFYRDAKGDLWRADDVQQGRNTTLNSVTSALFDGWFKSEAARFAAKNKERLNLMETRSTRFFATSSKAPGIDTLDSLNWSETRTFLTGQVRIP
ncbi:MAG: hypothetical protein OSB65_14945 [Roseibacillus sp.]|nr:hypothetical protein [Roseibacillus sp.]